MSGQSAIADARATGSTGQWAWHLSALALIVLAIGAMFQYEILNAVEVWEIYPAYSHCFLIIPICAWLVWRKRAQLARMQPSLAPKALLILPLAMLAWLVGYFATINEIRQFAVVGMFVVAILTLLGPHVFRVVLFPALYLFFLVPFGQYFIPPMQQFTARFTDVGLNLLSVPHYTEGTIFELPNGRFEIADACAGLRFLTAAIALGVLFVQLTYTKWWKSVAFLAACVIVPLIANGLRCVGTMALAFWTNDFAAVAANHITAGFVFNVIILLIMFWIGSMYRDVLRDPEQTPQFETRNAPRAALLAVAAATLVIIAGGPALAYWQENRPAPNLAANLTFPRVGAGWIIVPPSAKWYPVYAAPDRQLDNAIAPQAMPASAVDVKVLYYDRIRKKTSLISTMNRLWNGEDWYGVAERNADAKLGTRAVRFDENMISNASEKRLIWSSYWIDGQFTTSAVQVKLLQLKAMILGNEGTALITFSTPVNGPIEDARERLKAALLVLGDLPNDLDLASRPTQSSRSSD